MKEAKRYWESFFDVYPAMKRWREKESMMFDLGERETRTLNGRRRLEVDTKTKRWNTPIQGLAADTLKAIAVAAYERREEIPGLEMVGLVHDEVILLVALHINYKRLQEAVVCSEATYHF